jgi:hypothetical protein
MGPQCATCVFNMALSDNPFIGLPLATLTQMQTDWLQCLSDLAKAGQTYTMGGRTMTRANLPEIRTTLSELRIAISNASGGGAGKQSANAIIDTQSRFSG